jgi:hypothetical protein
MTTFLGGIQLINNIQIHNYENETQSWLSLFMRDTFIDFVAYGPKISGLTASSDGTWFAYFQQNPEKSRTEFHMWKYNQINGKNHEIVPYTQLNIVFDAPAICFNKLNTHVACLVDWNRVSVIDLRRLDAPTEFYRVGDEVGEQGIYVDNEDCFVWVSDNARVIDLTTRHPTMRTC